MAFIAQFIVTSVVDYGNDNVQVNMSADTSTKSDFSKWTPSGDLKFSCNNPEVIKQIAPGKKFRMTFEEA